MKINKISVLLPVYYKENPEYLDAALNSIFIQSIYPEEIVIVKDGYLTRDLDYVIDAYMKNSVIEFKIVALATHSGIASALNAGLKVCKNKYVARADSDDINHKDRFKEQIEHINNSKYEIDVLGAWISEFSENAQKITGIRKVPQCHEKILEFAKFRCPVNHMTVLYKKDSVLNVGGYDTSMSGLEDYDLWVRMLLRGYRFENINKSLVFARIHNLVNKRSGLNYLKKEIRLQKRFLSYGFLNIFDLMLNVIIRLPLRLSEKRIINLFYRYLARYKPSEYR